MLLQNDNSRKMANNLTFKMALFFTQIMTLQTNSCTKPPTNNANRKGGNLEAEVVVHNALKLLEYFFKE